MRGRTMRSRFGMQILTKNASLASSFSHATRTALQSKIASIERLSGVTPRALKGTDFASESDIVFFLEIAYEVIRDYEVPGFEDLYLRLLRGVLHKFNLRYRVDDPFTIR